jgi:drug/metabolite transporter (DMT)-like permease
MLSERQLGFLAVFIGGMGYAFLPVFTRMIYSVSDFQPTDIAIWRYIFATPIIWLMIQLRSGFQQKNKNPECLPLKSLLPMGVFYAGAAVSVFVGLQFIPASLFIVLFFTYPAMVAVISAFLGHRLSRNGWIALALTILGIAFTLPDFSGLERGAIIGISIALFNGLVVAVYFILIARVTRNINDMARTTAWVITGSLITLLFFIPFFGLKIPQTPQMWLILVGIASISTAMPIFGINTGIRLIGAPHAAIVSATEPVMSIILAVLILGEVVIATQWVGAALIVSAVIVLEIRPRRKLAPQTSMD